MNAQGLIDALEDTDRHIRDDAFDRIAASKDPALLDPLVSACSENEARFETLLCRYLQNIDPELSIPHLLRLLHASNARTQERAFATADTLPDDDQIRLLTSALPYASSVVLVEAFQRLGVLRRPSVIPSISPYVWNEDEDVAAAACEALGKFDSPRAVKSLLDLAQTSDAPARVHAVEALALSPSFKKWRRLLPLLKAPDKNIRGATIRAVSKWGGRGASKALVEALYNETDEDIAKLLLNTLGKRSEARAARAVIQTAGTHPDPQIRRAAGWIVEEIPEALFLSEGAYLLSHSEDATREYLLVKLGHRQVPDAGSLITPFLEANHTQTLRLAAVQGLGMLGDGRFLSAVEPLIESADPVESYAATLAASQMVSQLDESPVLRNLLTVPDKGSVLLKQVVLQYLIDAMTLNTEDSALIDAVLGNMRSANTNICYLSVRLAGRLRARSAILPLVEIIETGDDEDIAEAALSALDEILDGDVASLTIGDSRVDAELLSRLSLNTESAEVLLTRLTGLGQMSEHVRKKLAVRLYGAAPRSVREALREMGFESEWGLALATEWLAKLDLRRQIDREDWRFLFGSGNPTLVDAAQRLACEQDAKWAVEDLLPVVYAAEDDALRLSMRRSVKVLLGF